MDCNRVVLPTWEHVANILAARAGIDVPEATLESVMERPVLVSRRFDRRGQQRVPFLSAMAMLGVTDGGEAHSYLEIADAIRQHGAVPQQDLEQLWRRMVFSVLISNTDDHLRNHGFLRAEPGWLLAPAYDLNPVPVDVRPRIHALALDEASADSSLETCLQVANYFGVSDARAVEVAKEVAAATESWRTVARQHGIEAAGIGRMASAFEHDDSAAAARLS